MTPLHVELLPPRHVPRWAWGLLGIAALFAAALWLADAWQRHQVQALRVQQQQQQQTAQAAQAQARASAAIPQAPLPHHASAHALLAQHQYPWPAVLATMEAITIEGAVPVALDINAAQKTARIDLNATSYAAALAYLSALNQGDPTLQWRLQQISVAGEGRMSAVLVLAPF